MKTTIILLTMVIGLSAEAQSQPKPKPIQLSTSTPSIVDFDGFVKLAEEVKEYRKDRLVNLKDFLKMSVEKNTIILDTRSDVLYARKHIKGALHIDFTDFTQQNLANVIPNMNTRILIYCNNNFWGDQINFATKASPPPTAYTDVIGEHKPVSLALNIPTYINLYGYGYKNIYELSELVMIGGFMGLDPILVEFEGTDVPKKSGTN